MRVLGTALILAWAVLLPASGSPDTALPPVDIRYAPTPQQREAILGQGWAAARDLLAEALAAGYHPGLAGRPGSAGVTAYRQWLTLWKWCDLLARTEEEEFLSFLGRFLFEKPGHKQPAFVPPGLSPDEDMTPAPAEFVRSLASDNRLRSTLMAQTLADHIPHPAEVPISERLDPGLIAMWMADPALSHTLFATLSPDDYAPGVLHNLQEIARAHPESFSRHAALAVAIAVVYDAAMPAFWPHRQVPRDSVPIVDVSPADWFAHWVAVNDARALLTDLRTLPPSQLKFVIDAPLNPSEFEWARRSFRLSRAQFARAFSAVDYDHPRVAQQRFAWDHGEYTLAKIHARGGICVDQAYFAMVAGKARGLPTLFFTGQGSDGGHAWFGFMRSGDRWEMDAGRYENQNYAVGHALDPQSWRPISDHELRSLAEGFRETDSYAASRDDILLAGLFERRGDEALAARAYESAISVCPQNPAAWDARGQFLARSGAPPDDRRAFHETALRQFETRRDLRVRHQLALAKIAREVGDAEAADAIERRIVSQNRRLRADLSVSAAARRLGSLVDEKKLDEAFEEYRRMLRSLSRTGGGNFFYDIVLPFTQTLAEAGDSARALEASELARRQLRPEPDSVLAQDFQSLEAALRSSDSTQE